MPNHFRFIFVSVFISLGLSAQVQKNVFLERDYWRSMPDVAKVTYDIKAGNNPAELTSSAFDPAVYAILEKAPNETISYLLKQPGNDVNKITHDHRTYIFWAAYAGNTALIEQLLVSGAKTDIHDDHNYTALTFAAANGQQDLKVFDILLENGFKISDVDENGANALLLATPTSSDFKVINYFSQKGLNIESLDANGNSAFNYAAKTGNIDFLGSLIKKGVSYNDNAFVMASAGTRGTSNKLETYKFLKSLNLKPGAKGKNGENAFHNLAKKPEQLGIIQWFIENGADVNLADKEGNTPLMNAASGGEISLITLLADKSADINQANKKGMTALSFAVKGNSPEVVQLLISRGAKTAITDSEGNTLAAYLIQSYNPKKPDAFDAKWKIVEKSGLNLSEIQPNGNSLYHLAIAKNDLDLLKKISANKIDINAKNKEGYTALHKAAMTAKNDEILKYLVSIGARKDEVTDMKESAFDLASENEYLSKNNVSVQFLK